ncbi:MAG: pilus assembly protein PilM, partial [bacterium]
LEGISGHLRLTALGYRELGKGVIAEKEIRDNETLIYAIQGLIEEIDPEMTDFYISIAGKKVLLDRFPITGASTKRKEMLELVLATAEERIPTGTENLSIDFHILEMDTKKKQADVLMIAAYDEYIRSFVDVLSAGGFNVLGIETDYLAFFNAFEKNMLVPPEGCVALINIGHTLTNLVIIADSKFHSARDLSTGTRDVWERIQRELRLSTDELTTLIRGETEWFDQTRLKTAMYLGVDDLKIALDTAFAYFENISSGRKIEKIYLSGGGAIIPYLPDAIAAKLELPHEIIDPFKAIDVDPSVFTYSTPEKVGPLFTVAVGLALPES